MRKIPAIVCLPVDDNRFACHGIAAAVKLNGGRIGRLIRQVGAGLGAAVGADEVVLEAVAGGAELCGRCSVMHDTVAFAEFMGRMRMRVVVVMGMPVIEFVVGVVATGGMHVCSIVENAPFSCECGCRDRYGGDEDCEGGGKA